MKEGKVAKLQHKTPSPRHRVPQEDADILFTICVKYMEHEKAVILRKNTCNILCAKQHCLHVRYIYAENVKLLVLKHQEQEVIKSMINVGHSVVSDNSILGMQVRRDGSNDETRQRRNSYCAHRALTRTVKRGNLAKSVTLFCKKEIKEVEAAFQAVFTPKDQAEFDQFYREKKRDPAPSTTKKTTQSTAATATPRDISVLTSK